MRLYSGSSKQFIDDTVRNQIAQKLSDAFFYYYRYHPPREKKDPGRTHFQECQI